MARASILYLKSGKTHDEPGETSDPRAIGNRHWVERRYGGAECVVMASVDRILHLSLNKWQKSCGAWSACEHSA